MQSNTLLDLIAKQKFKFAKTYAKTYPHEYFMGNENAELYTALLNEIKDNGYTKNFYNTPFRYVDIDGYKYWHHGKITMNREPLAGYTPEQIQDFTAKGFTS